jgi:hypothetical protein
MMAHLPDMALAQRRDVREAIRKEVQTLESV